MRIGIDISQIVHEGTGVARYVRELVRALLTLDATNEYVLFGSSLRKQHVFKDYFDSLGALTKKTRLVTLPFSPTILEFLWNQLGVIPIEYFVGDIDVFWSSDWMQPPLARARGITTVHDVSFLRFPESFDKKIIDVQMRRLARAKKLCSAFLCDSQASKKDTLELLNIPNSKLHVVYPGI